MNTYFVPTFSGFHDPLWESIFYFVNSPTKYIPKLPHPAHAPRLRAPTFSTCVRAGDAERANEECRLEIGIVRGYLRKIFGLPAHLQKPPARR